MPVFCVISHIVALAFHDEAFGVAAMTPQNLFDLGVRPGMKRQQIPWRDDVGERPIFCAPTATCATGNEDQVLALPYHLYQGWVKRLGEETGFVKVLTTYCLRRAAGNAINGKLGPTHHVKLSLRFFQMIPTLTRRCVIWCSTMV